ncbi:MAG TPA: alkaline phosphatase D family protein [Moraxellaceae bacterium]|nr:alkaline phosphatase D family protein [Moraxellaceae bacterium]
MKRREFIRLGGFLTVSVAAMGMTGCDIVGDNNNASTSAQDPNLYPNPVRPMPAAAAGANWSFPQSVATGDPKSDSIIFWTRVLNDPAPADPTVAASVDAAITLQVTAADNSASLGSTTALTGTLVANVAVPAYFDFDGTVRHKLTGLAPDTVYFYQFVAGTVLSKVGRFKTAPAATSSRSIKFAALTCQDWSTNHWGSLSDIVANDVPATPSLDFVVHLGDYIYETDNANVAGLEGVHGVLTLPDGTAIPPERTTGLNPPPAPPGMYATTNADYRYLYKKYRSDPRLQALHERFPFVAIWDDHEFSDDCWMDAETYSNDNALQIDRRRSANRAWFEYMPADVSFQEVNPGFQNIQLYRDLKFGTVMHLVMTDERLYRQDHLIPENTLNPLYPASAGVELGRINSRYLAPEGSLKLAEQIKDAAAPDLALISMLGLTQRQWWKSTMSASTATWKVWGNEVSLLRMGLNGTKAVGTLIALQTIQGTAALMNAELSDPNVQGLPKVEAGAKAAVGLGATPPVAIAGSFAIATYITANPTDPNGAIAAGVSAGLTSNQATAALTAISTTVPTSAQIGICATTVVAATQAYMTTNMAQATAQQTAAVNVVAALLTDDLASNAAPDAALLAALKGTVLDDTAGTVVLNVYKAAKAAGASGQSAQVAAGAAAFAAAPYTMFVRIRAEVETYTVTSSYVIASGQLASLAPFFRKFIINADQWDGYRKERADLTGYLAANGIQNVVGVTGDIHAFFAGTVHPQFASEVLTVDASGNELTAASASASAAMVDLVTAGVSSTSWYQYLNAAAAALSSSLTTLVSYTIPSASTGLPFNLNLPVLDFSLGKVFSPAALVTMVTDAIRDGAAGAGVPESALGGTAGIASIANTVAGNTSLQFLCYALSVMGQEVNPWLAHVDSNAQGYSVVTASTASLTCEFRHVNAAFVTGGVGYAPGVIGGTTDTRSVVSRVVTATVTAGSASVVIS